MRITIINNSDSRGGAAIASFRMLEALRSQGVDARMLVMHKGTRSQWVQHVEPAWRRKACFLAEHLDIFAHNGLSRAKLFQASTARWGMPLHSHPWVKHADYVLLGWINQGMLSLSEIAKIKAPVAWVMHDMWCLTGACHHAGLCRKYEKMCDSCRLFRGSDESTDQPHDLSWSTWMRKQELYSAKSILFIAVSHWLAGKCAESALLGKQRVEVVPNAFPVADFIAKRNDDGANVKTIVMGAARLDDPIKGLDLAIDALNILDERKVKARAVFFGDLKDPNALDRLTLPYVHVGPLNMEQIKELYATSHVVLSSSHYETLPTTLIEGMAAGCVPVTFGQGGQADIVDHFTTGYIAQYPDAADLARGLEWALAGNVDTAALPEAMSQRFSAEAVAKRLLTILNENNEQNTQQQ